MKAQTLSFLQLSHKIVNLKSISGMHWILRHHLLLLHFPKRYLTIISNITIALFGCRDQAVGTKWPVFKFCHIFVMLAYMQETTDHPVAQVSFCQDQIHATMRWRPFR